MSRRLFSGLLVLAILSLSLVSAKSVYRWTEIVDDHYTLPHNTDQNPCDFDIDWNFHGSAFWIVWWDEVGVIYRAILVDNQIDEAYSANGKTLKGQGNTIHYSLTPDGRLIMTYLGTSGFYIVPGAGPVWGNAGQYSAIYVYDPNVGDIVPVETLRVAGIFKYSDFSPICRYLAP